MSAEQISVISTVAFILDKLGTLPIGGLLAAIVLGPWIGMFLISRGQEKRFEAVRQMYESNVKLVEDYAKMADGLQDLVILNTQAMTEVKETAEHNLYCPLVRKKTQQQEASP